MKDAFARKFFGAGEESAVGASASTYGTAATGRGSPNAGGMAADQPPVDLYSRLDSERYRLDVLSTH